MNDFSNVNNEGTEAINK